MNNVTVIAFIGVLFATFLRALLPFLFKLKEAVEKGEKIEWSQAYTFTTIFALITGLVTAFIGFPLFQIPDAEPLQVFVLAFAYGWTLTDLLNKVFVDWRKKPEPELKVNTKK